MGTLVIGLIGGVTALGMFCILMSLIYESDHNEYTKLHNSIVIDTMKYEDFEVNTYSVIIEEPTE